MGDIVLMETYRVFKLFNAMRVIKRALDVIASVVTYVMMSSSTSMDAGGRPFGMSSYQLQWENN